MDAFEALLLGIVQGLTEWLPVSSSGHLVIVEEMLKLHASEYIVFDLVVHLGTLLAVTFYFRKELGSIVKALVTPKDARDARSEGLRRLGLLLLVALIPIGVVGVILTDNVQAIFNIGHVGLALVMNGVLLLIFERFGSHGKKRQATLSDAVAIGICQAVSIIPGISRSGTTLGGGMMAGLERETAAVFAFLLSVPTLGAAFAYGALTLDYHQLDLLSATIGFAAAFLTGLASIDLFLRSIRARKLWVFAIYCFGLGAATMVAAHFLYAT
jgi:undecaprenyl-diphosphatase